MGAITPEILKNFLLGLVPLFILWLTGYALARLKILTPEHGIAFNLYMFWVAVPAFVFKRIALLDPNDLDGLLLAADFVSKMLPLIVMLCWWRLAKNGSIDWVITICGLVGLPNTVLIGDAILESIYGSTIRTKTTTIIFAQSLYWYNLLIIMYEIREVLIETAKENEPARESTETGENDDQGKPYLCPEIGGLEKQQSGLHGLPVASPERKSENGLEFASNTPGEQDPQERKSANGLEFASNTPGGLDPEERKSANGFEFASNTPRVQEPQVLSRVAGKNATGEQISSTDKNHTPGVRHVLSVSFDMSRLSISARPSVEEGFCTSPSQQEKVVNPPDSSQQKAFEHKVDEKRIDVNEDIRDFHAKPKKKKHRIVFIIITRILKNMSTWASVLGLSYSFAAKRYNLTMPYYIENSITLLGAGLVVTGVIILGMAVGHRNTFLLCSKREMFAGWGLRFLIAPITMAVGAYVVGLKGELLRYAIVQTVIPQGSIVYTFSLKYGLHEGISATAVLTQMIVFIPCLLALYSALDAF